jgi:hypothetical protein
MLYVPPNPNSLAGSLTRGVLGMVGKRPTPTHSESKMPA